MLHAMYQKQIKKQTFFVPKCRTPKTNCIMPHTRLSTMAYVASPSIGDVANCAVRSDIIVDGPKFRSLAVPRNMQTQAHINDVYRPYCGKQANYNSEQNAQQRISAEREKSFFGTNCYMHVEAGTLVRGVTRLLISNFLNTEEAPKYLFHGCH